MHVVFVILEFYFLCGEEHECTKSFFLFFLKKDQAYKTKNHIKTKKKPLALNI